MRDFCINKSFFLLLFVLLSGACSQGDYSMQTEYLVDFCVVKERGSQSLYLASDAGRILTPSSSLDLTDSKVGQRYRVTYINIGGGQYSVSETVIKVIDMQPVFTENVMPLSQFPTGLKDPLSFISEPWQGGGYLNFEFSFRFSDQAIIHSIHLIQDSIVSRASKKLIYLSLVHDAAGDKLLENSALIFKSFPLNTVSGIEKSDSLIITALRENELKPMVFRLLADSIANK